jgi:hypothetical protein
LPAGNDSQYRAYGVGKKEIERVSDMLAALDVKGILIDAHCCSFIPFQLLMWDAKSGNVYHMTLFITTPFRSGVVSWQPLHPTNIFTFSHFHTFTPSVLLPQHCNFLNKQCRRSPARKISLASCASTSAVCVSTNTCLFAATRPNTSSTTLS